MRDVSTIDCDHSSFSFFSSSRRWVNCLTAALFFFFIFIQINIFNALDPALIRSFHLSTAAIGQLSAMYFLANVIFMFPAGLILDRFSTRWVILIALGLTVLATFAMAYITAIWQGEMLRFVIGLTGAFCLIAEIRLATRWFLPQQMALIVGLIVTMAMTGGMVAQTPFTLLTNEFGWQNTLLIDSGIGAVFFVLIFFIVRDRPQQPISSGETSHTSELGFWHSIGLVVLRGQNWLAGLFASLLNLPIFILGATWGGFYLVQAHHMTRDQASVINMMIFLGFIIGSPSIGWISDHWRRRKLPMLFGALFSLVIVLMIMLMPQLSFWALMALFFALGVGISAQIIAYPLVAESNSPALTGTAEGLASLLIMAGGFAIPLFSDVLNWHWDHLMRHHMPIYSASDYRLAFAIMPLAFVLSFIAALFTKETRCQLVMKNK